jgi:chromosome segregation ATPase
MTPTLQASDLDVEGLVRDLPALREEAESFAKAAHAGVTDLAALVSLLLAEVDTATAQLAAEKARADKAEEEATKLQNYRQLHGGDVLSLSNDLAIEHEQVEELSAQLAAAEANLAAANKQIEEMRGAREQAIEECAKVCEAEAEKRFSQARKASAGDASWGIDTVASSMAQDHKAITAQGLAHAIRALSHEAHNG